MRTTTVAWISIALLSLCLPSLGWGADSCPAPPNDKLNLRITQGLCRSVTVEDLRRAEVAKVPDGRGFNVYMHPFGERIVTTTTTFFPPGRPPRTDRQTQTYPANLFEDCRTCDGNQDAGYQLKIFSKNHDPTKGQKFTKPILVTQGFDASYKLPDQFGFGQFEEMLNHVFHKDDTTIDLTCPGPAGCETGLLSQLYNEGYDIALLLWKNPLIDIRTNARVTAQALQWLEDHTDIRPGTEPVIIGPSLGGLVTRYALQLVGSRTIESNIRARLFIAFDSPNRGAEIPMSLQALLSYLADQFAEAGNQLLANLSSMGARQLLLSSVVLDRDFMLRPGFHLTGVSQVILDYENPNDPRNITASAHATFMADINRPDFRANIKNIVHPVAGGQEPIYMAAIINGSGIGLDLGYTEDLLYATGSSATALLGLDKLDIELRTAMPRSEVTVFYGDVNPHGLPGADKDAFTYNFEEPAFVENAPGGLRNTYWQVIGLVDAAGYPWKDVDEHFCAEDVPPPCRKLTSGPRGNHAFIPSISSAGVLNRDINNNTSFYIPIETMGRCAGGTQFCMFDEFRAPETNQRHVAVTQENKRWFLDLIHTYGPRGLGPDLVPVLASQNSCEIRLAVENRGDTEARATTVLVTLIIEPPVEPGFGFQIPTPPIASGGVVGVAMIGPNDLPGVCLDGSHSCDYTLTVNAAPFEEPGESESNRRNNTTGGHLACEPIP
jgi:hypothetical protein